MNCATEEGIETQDTPLRGLSDIADELGGLSHLTHIFVAKQRSGDEGTSVSGSEFNAMMLFFHAARDLKFDVDGLCPVASQFDLDDTPEMTAEAVEAILAELHSRPEVRFALCWCINDDDKPSLAFSDHFTRKGAIDALGEYLEFRMS